MKRKHVQGCNCFGPLGCLGCSEFIDTVGLKANFSLCSCNMDVTNPFFVDNGAGTEPFRYDCGSGHLQVVGKNMTVFQEFNETAWCDSENPSTHIVTRTNYKRRVVFGANSSTFVSVSSSVSGHELYATVTTYINVGSAEYGAFAVGSMPTLPAIGTIPDGVDGGGFINWWTVSPGYNPCGLVKAGDFILRNFACPLTGCKPSFPAQYFTIRREYKYVHTACTPTGGYVTLPLISNLANIYIPGTGAVSFGLPIYFNQIKPTTYWFDLPDVSGNPKHADCLYNFSSKFTWSGGMGDKTGFYSGGYLSSTPDTSGNYTTWAIDDSWFCTPTSIQVALNA